MRKDFTRELRDPRPGEIESFLSRHGVRKMEVVGGELRFAPCPVCRNQKKNGSISGNTRADVNLKSGLWRCFGCGVRGNWLTLTRSFGDELPRHDRYKDQRPEDLWKHRDFYASQKRHPVTSGVSPALLHYCHERGIVDETLNRWLVSIATWPPPEGEPWPQTPEALRWPMLAWEEGKWQMVNAKLKKCLNIQPDEARSRFQRGGGPTQLAIGQHLIRPEHGSRVFVWEGEFDAMVADQLGVLNSVSLPNGASAVHVGQLLRYIPDDWEIYVGMDHDDAGQKAVELFFAQVEPKRLRQIMLPENPHAEPDAQGKRARFKDLNEWHLAAPGLLTAEDVLRCAVGVGLPPARQAPALMSLGQIQAKVAARSDEDTKLRLVCEMPWPALSKMLKGGLFTKQTTGFLAPSGIGKTTAVNQIAIHAAAQRCKTGLMSFEDDRDTLFENVNQAALGWLDVDSVAIAADHLLVSPLEGSDVTADEISEEVHRFAKAGARLVIVDNLDHVCETMDAKMLTYRMLMRLAKELDLHIIVVWQCGKVPRNAVVNSGNQKGYSQTFQDAANYINMNRLLSGGEELSRLEIEKTRSGGTSFTNCHVWLKYVDGKRCFYPVEGNVISITGGAGNGVQQF